MSLLRRRGSDEPARVPRHDRGASGALSSMNAVATAEGTSAPCRSSCRNRVTMNNV